MTLSTDDGSIYLPYLVVALPILIFFPLIVRTLSRIKLSRLYHSRTMLAMYEPPAGLSPAEIGYMYDAKMKMNELVATVFDLEYKNIITIDETGNLSLTTVNSQHSTLKPHESFIVGAISHGKYYSLFQDLDIVNAQKFKLAVTRSLVSQGFIQPHLYQRIFIGALRMTRNVFFFYSSLIILFFGLMQLGAVASTRMEILLVSVIMFIVFTVFFAPLYVGLGIILTFMYVKLDGMRWIGTGLLKRTWPDIEGYRMYIKQAQLNRLNFASEELRVKALEKDFAYAVALQMKVDWKSRFKAN